MPQWLHANVTQCVSVVGLGWVKIPCSEDSSGLDTQSSGNHFSQKHVTITPIHRKPSGTSMALTTYKVINVTMETHTYSFTTRNTLHSLNIVTGMIWTRQATVNSSASVSHAVRGAQRLHGNTLSVMTTWKGKRLKSCLLELTSMMVHISDSL